MTITAWSNVGPMVKDQKGQLILTVTIPCGMLDGAFHADLTLGRTVYRHLGLRTGP